MSSVNEEQRRKIKLTKGFDKMKRKPATKKDMKKFSKTADKTKAINVKPVFMRGGIRL